MLPRDLLLLMQREDLYAFLKQQEETRIIETIDLLNTFKHVYIYMPTFRDTGRDFISDANIDFDLLNATMRETESLFIFKLHRETKSQKLAEARKYSNLSIIDSKIDVYPLLPYTTCLITDYSSIYFDYLLMDDKRIIFYPFDYEEYKAQDRDFNFDESYMKGEYAQSFEQLLSLFKIGEKQIPHISQEENRLLFWNNHTNVEELVDAIIKIARE